MERKKFECKNGWIVIVAQKDTGEVCEIHSNGYTSYGSDDNATNDNFWFYIESAILNNELHTQQPGKLGIRWPNYDD